MAEKTQKTFPEFGCSFAASWVWLWLHAGLQVVLYPVLLYCGLCTFWLPATLYIMCRLAGSLRGYVLLNLPILLFLAVTWWVAWPLGFLLSLQWLPCFLLGMSPLNAQKSSLSCWQRVLVYVLALCPYALILPFVLCVYQACHR
ncbi:MAG: hypothetical protein IKV82_02555 [Akkermansia sp.]|nr:hypothetical protein [Akkermansia sp.]